jgi:glycosyltransferase involved in cell wall biosynthesis
MVDPEKIKVSVRVMVFNHAEYIKEAIASILMQRTDFITEIVIGDDFSTDNSLEIVNSFSSTEKFIIKILERRRGDAYDKERKRLGRLYNFTDIIKQCEGEYIALLDGDDYWSDTDKLQKQVDMLDSNKELVLSHTWHTYGIYGEASNFKTVNAPKEEQGYFPSEISDVTMIISNKMRCKSRTIMYRNIIEEFPEWFFKVAYGDVALTMILGKYGKFGFIDLPMAVYRQTGLGVSKVGKNQEDFHLNHNLEWIKVWEYGDLFYGYKYKNLSDKTIRQYIDRIIEKNSSKKSALKGLISYFRKQSVGTKSYKLKMKLYVLWAYFRIKQRVG